jgi:hypothetical protein
MYGQTSTTLTFTFGTAARRTTFDTATLTITDTATTAGHVHYLTPSFEDASAGAVLRASAGRQVMADVGYQTDSEDGPLVTTSVSGPVGTDAANLAVGATGRIA